MNRKKERKKKNKRIHLPFDLSLRAQVIIIACGLFMVVCLFTVLYTMMGNYDGLGLRQEMAYHDYDPKKLTEKNGRLYYEDETYYSVCGIDVSYYQKDIDWEKVKADGIDFVMIRLGYRGSESGEIHMDSKFKENLKGARAAGLDVGVYFFSQAINTDEAIAEARYVLRNIRGKGIHYPVVYDMEPVSGDDDRIAGLTKEERTEIADAFCQVIGRKGHTPMVYGNEAWLLKRIDGSYLTDYGTWLAHYTDGEMTDYPYAFSLWQYTDQGKVKGIKGRVDLDILLLRK